MDTETNQNNNMSSSTSDQPNKPVEQNPLSTLEPNIAAALSYLVPPFTGILFFLVEKDNKFVRFHAFQSMLFGFAVWVAMFVANALIMVLIGVLLVPLVSIATVILWVVLLWKAYNNEEYLLPVIGKMAKEQANK